MKTLVLAVGALIVIAGLGVFLFPAAVLALARHPVTRLQLYASAVIRVGLGALFIAVARDARLPWLLRLIGGFLLVAGIGTFLLGLERAGAIANWISQRSPTEVRLFGTVPVILGVLVIHACRGARRAV
jgi:uncharacterized protein YjeT (DUF2065 family)